MSKTRAAIYCRISYDRNHDELGVRRQEDDCRALCERKGWTIADVYADDDTSAYSGKRRPEYERLVESVKDGAVNAIVAWHPDRLHRRPSELEDFIVLVEASNVKVATVQAGEVDLSTASGRMTARVVGAVARHESEHKGERVRAKYRELVAAGKPNGGSTRPFGYEADKVTVRPKEAKVLRAAAKRVIRGDTLSAITRWLNDASVSTVTGKPWQLPTVRQMLINPRYAGLRAVGKGAAQRVVSDATWPAILDRSTHEQVRAILTDPGRRTNRTARTYLLSGLVECSECGSVMVSQARHDRTSEGVRKVRTYSCIAAPGRSGCGRRRIVAEPLERYVVEAVAENLETGKLRAAEDGAGDEGDETGAERRDIDERLARLAAEYGAGNLTDAAWSAANNALMERRQALATRVRRARRPALLEQYDKDPTALAREWPRLSFERQRAIVAATLEAVVIGPGRRGRRAPVGERVVDVRWRA